MSLGRFKGRTMEEKLSLNWEPGEGGCWLWTGKLTKKGYATVTTDGRRGLIHRLAYEIWKGPITEGLEIDHLCRARHCLNPDHLEAVTHLENLRRRPTPTHCPQGHEHSDANTKWTHGGRKRRCRRCFNDQRSAARSQKREAMRRAG